MREKIKNTFVTRILFLYCEIKHRLDHELGVTAHDVMHNIDHKRMNCWRVQMFSRNIILWSWLQKTGQNKVVQSLIHVNKQNSAMISPIYTQITKIKLEKKTSHSKSLFTWCLCLWRRLREPITDKLQNAQLSLTTLVSNKRSWHNSFMKCHLTLDASIQRNESQVVLNSVSGFAKRTAQSFSM